MGSAAVVALLLCGFAGAGLMGLVALLVAMNSTLAPSTAFAWGATLGPIGVVTVIVVVTKSKKHVGSTAVMPEVGW
jgi:hypothetical protein